MAVGRRGGGGNTPAPPTAASCWSDMQTWFNMQTPGPGSLLPFHHCILFD